MTTLKGEHCLGRRVPDLTFHLRYMKLIQPSLARIVYDEVHVYVTQEHFRPHLGSIEWLSTLNCQKVALSATIPRSLEGAILKSVGLHPSNPVIREPSVQHHIKYHLLSSPNMMAALDLLTALIQFLEENILEHGRQGFIFFKGKKACEEYAEMRGYPFNHSGLEKEKKDVEMDKFTSGKSRWLCATPGLASGVNVSTIDITVFFGLPYGLIDFYQSCGRGSRAGKRSDAIVVNIKDDKRLRNPMSGLDAQLWTPLVEWSKGAHACDRHFLTEHLDGDPKSCKDLRSAAPCCRCASDALNMQLIGLQGKISRNRQALTPPPESFHDGKTQTKKRNIETTEAGEMIGPQKRAKTQCQALHTGDALFAAASARSLYASKREASVVRVLSLGMLRRF